MKSFVLKEALSLQVFTKLAALLEAWSGIRLNENKRQMMEVRLKDRISLLECDRFQSYLELVEKPGSLEKQHFIDALTTNETYFYREPYHFEFLSKLLKEEFSSCHRINMWSAAASYGEEAYSLSMVAASHFSSYSKYNLLATDISNEALKKAKGGEFEAYDFRMLPDNFLQTYVHSTEHIEKLKIVEDIKKTVQFKMLNLIEPFKMYQQFEIIFLRNVLIYFDLETKIKVVQNVVKHLKPGGYFFISISESPLAREICKNTQLESLGKGVFKLVK